MRLSFLKCLSISGLLAMGLVGCDSQADRIMKQQLDLIYLATAAERNNVDDDVRQQIEEQAEESLELLKSLKLTREQKKALENRYKKKMDEAMDRYNDIFFESSRRRFSRPGNWDFDGFPNFPSRR